MKIRNNIIEKETENRLSSLTWDDCIVCFNGLTDPEKKQFMDCIVSGGDDIRNLFFANIKRNIKNRVAVEVDGYIQSGQIPLSVLNNILE
jgi:hypothetical protein